LLNPTPISTRISRRSLLAGAASAAIFTACGRKKAVRYPGWLLVASPVEKTVAVANLDRFHPLTKVPLPHAPDRLLRLGGRIFAVSAEAAQLTEIDRNGFRAGESFPLPGKPVSVLPGPNGQALVFASDPAAIFSLDPVRRTVTGRLALPSPPGDADFSGGVLAVSIPASGSVLRVRISELRVIAETDLGVSCGVVRFRKDGKTILAGAPAARQVVTLDTATGALLTRLSLAIQPSRFCFNPDGGQMFVSGPGEDAIVIVNPYQNEVDQTILAGRAPGAMAVSERQNLLFIANPDAGDLTILEIDSRSLCASVHVGENPSEVLVTPDSEYALAVDGRSGNVSVVRIASVPLPTSPRRVSGVVPLFTSFPTAAGAQSAMIVPFRG
jgi:DNA-binding beta-propeller fold protein YncE